MCDGEPVSLLQQEKRQEAHSLGLDVRRVTREVGTGAWHRRWRAVTHPGIPSSGALSAGKWKPQLLLHEWETVETKEWRSLEVGGNRKGVFCLLWVSSSRCRGGLRRGPRGIASVNRKPGVLTHFSFILMAFLLFQKGRKKAKSFLPDLGPCH